MGVWQDVRFAFRVLIRQPGFAAVAVATLALGIGANTAVFSLVEAVLLRPLPFREPERLVMVWERSFTRDRLRNVVNPGNYFAWRERNRVFEDIAAFGTGSRSLSGAGEPVRLDAGAVTPNFFELLGVPMLLGRGFSAQEWKPGGPSVVVLSEGLWRRRFGGDEGVLGSTLELNRQPATVIGVAPASLQVPPGAELWVPISEQFRTAGGRSLLTVARLKPGVSVEQARAEIETIAARLAAEDPDQNAGWGASLFPLHADLVRDIRPALLVLLGAVAAVLLIACGNLANLLLARALGREREIAVRRALGASQGRLLRQLFAESLVLAAAGAAAGLLLAAWLAQALAGVVPPEARALFAPRLDGQVLAFTLAVSLACALLFGLAPAFRAARTELVPSLREGSAGAGQGRQRRRLSRLLVAGEVAVSLVLLVGAGLLLSSFARLSRVEAGFRAKGVLSMQVSLPAAAYAEPVRQQRFYDAVLERLRALPGVSSAAGISWRPLSVGSATRFMLPDRPKPPAGQEPVADVRMVTPRLFETLGIRVLRGRDFDARDVAGRPDVVIVSDYVARTYWPGQDPIGRRIRMDWFRMLDAEVVGVVSDVKMQSLDGPTRAALWWPVAQVPNSFLTLLVRGDAPGLAAAAKAELGALDPLLPVARVEALDEAVAATLQRPRFIFLLTGAFAATAVLLAGLGLFGVVSYSVGQRLPEFGIRLALGARPADLARLVLGEGLSLAAAGVAAGLLAAFLLARVLESLLFEVRPRDPAAFAATTLLVLAVSLLAGLLPALRAGRVDPARALRAE